MKTLLICMCNFCYRLEFWPRLIVDEQKPAWLKINFDRWQSEDASDSEKEEQEQQAKLEVNIERLSRVENVKKLIKNKYSGIFHTILLNRFKSSYKLFVRITWLFLVI